MSRSGPRLHRLPKRTDYKLIPAPLDLSLPLATEKSSLPAIIVTPSSPSGERDFAIAFLAAPPKPSLCERFLSNKSLAVPGLRTRSILMVLFIIFILVCHLVTHSLAARRPYLDLTLQTNEPHVVDTRFSWYGFHSVFSRAVPAVDPADLQ